MYASVGKIPNPNSEEVNSAISAYIRQLLPVFLLRAVGEEMSERIMTKLSNTSEHEDESADILIEQLREPFADYVFYRILRDVNSKATVTGLIQLKIANKYVSPIIRQVSIWNSMVEKLRIVNHVAARKGIVLNSDPMLLKRINSLNL